MASRLFKAISGFLRGIEFSTKILIAVGIFIIIINPRVGFFTPRCLIKELTGYYCAGCGITTGIYALIRGDIAGAAEKNLLIVTLLPAALIYLIMRKTIFNYSGKYKYNFDKSIIIFFILTVVFFTIFRNVSISEFDVLKPH